MKDIPFADIFFIFLIAVIFSVVTYLGYSKFLSEYSVIIAIAAYFTGKYRGRIESVKKKSD